jgi:hypothetical protein
MSDADLDYIENELRQTTVPGNAVGWPPAASSTHWHNAYTRLESLRSTPPPPPPPPPPASHAWAWDATAATVASNSDARIAAFLKYGGPFAYFAAEVGVGVVDSHDPADSYSVSSAGKNGGPFDSTIYFPNGVAPGTATDGHLAIDDRITGRWHDFEMFKQQGYVNGKVTGWTGGCSMPEDAVQEPKGGGSHGGATVAKFPLLQGLITPDEVNAGAINHALVYTMTNCGPGPNPYPSNSSSGYTGPNVAMPTDSWKLMPGPGAWLAIDPSVDISVVTGFELMVATCLQRYGMFCRDRSTDCSLHGADLGGGGKGFAAWRAAGVNVGSSGSLKFSSAFIGLLQHLRVLNPPPVG